MKCLFLPFTAGFLALAGMFAADAASPEMVKQGRELFEREWTTRNPSMGSDGLGPLFNGKSCVACHNQGGIGGAGDAKFNAKTFGIEELKITGGQVTDDVVAAAVREFSPGFVDSTGGIVDTFAVQHHGGTSEFAHTRKLLSDNSLAEFTESGGPVSAAEVRYANSTPILYRSKLGQYEVFIRARLFQRNTTPLFGAGLIDRVDGKVLETLARLQERNPEISGRVSTLPDGRFGRFGWRGNIATLLEFNDNACAAEVGLETNRISQPADPTYSNYRNPAADISDEQIQKMTAFVASLPAPKRELPDNFSHRKAVLHGEKLFASVGCAACHVPNVGPAEGLYSDLLLHDMGKASIDLNPAEPYIYQVQPVASYSVRTHESIAQEKEAARRAAYYGRRSSIRVSSSNRYRKPRTTSFKYEPPTRTLDYIRYVSTGSNWRVAERYRAQKMDGSLVEQFAFNKQEAEKRDRSDHVKSQVQRVRVTRKSGLKLFTKGTNVAQEWRTPPLWGVRDSAPYMHDGRAETLLEAITLHGGESAATRDRFLNLPVLDRHAIIAFLNTMVAPQMEPQPAS